MNKRCLNGLLIAVLTVGVNNAFAIDISELPITLKDAFSYGLNKRLSLLRQQASLHIAKSELMETKGLYYPSVSLKSNLKKVESYDEFSGVSVVVIDQQTTRVDVVRDVPDYNIDAELALRWNIYSGGSRGALVDKAQGKLNIKKNLVELSNIKVMLEISEAYWGLIRTILDYQGTYEGYRLLLKKYKIIKRRFADGTASKVEMYEHDSKIFDNKILLANAEHQIMLALIEYSTAMGGKINEKLHVLDVLENIANMPEIIKDMSVDELDVFLSREDPDLTQVKEKINMEKANLLLEKSAYYPTIDIMAGYIVRGRNSSSLSDAVDDVDKAELGATLGINWTLYQGRQTSHRVAKARLHLKDARYALTEYFNKKNKSYQKSLTKLKNLKQIHNFTSEKYNLNAKKSSILDKKLKLGKISTIEHAEEHFALIQAKHQKKYALINLLEEKVNFSLLFGGYKDPKWLPKR